MSRALAIAATAQRHVKRFAYLKNKKKRIEATDGV
jgi:hypothetical protein